MSVTRVGGLLCALSLIFSGCQTIHEHKRVSPLEDDTAIGTASVSDSILQGQRLSIPRAGLPLSEALAAAKRPGSIENLVDAATGENKYVDLFVVIERGNSKFYLPLYLAENSQAGGLQVKAGDRLAVTSYKLAGTIIPATEFGPAIDTRLFARAAETQIGKTIEVSDYSGDKESRALTAQNGDLSKLAMVGSASTKGIDPNIILLTRVTGGLTEQFIIPRETEEFLLDAGHRNEALLRGGDQVHFTRLELLDLVRSGARQTRLAKEYERRNAQESKRKHLAQLHERVASGQGPLGLLHSICNDSIERVRLLPWATFGIPGIR